MDAIVAAVAMRHFSDEAHRATVRTAQHNRSSEAEAVRTLSLPRSTACTATRGIDCRVEAPRLPYDGVAAGRRRE